MTERMYGAKSVVITGSGDRLRWRDTSCGWMDGNVGFGMNDNGRKVSLKRCDDNV